MPPSCRGGENFFTGRVTWKNQSANIAVLSSNLIHPLALNVVPQTQTS
jgi:hypothetical protein